MKSFSLPTCALGVATSATQIEGGDADTNWHRWAREGRINDGSSPTRAADHWNRVVEDTALMASLGIRHYRMGLEWARIEPEPGAFDPKAIEHYRTELITLRDAGIRPLVTLHHFNNPVWFEDQGGFLASHAVAIYLRFVETVVRELGDLVDEWIPINEPNIYATYAFGEAVWPPARRVLLDICRAMSRMAEMHIRAYELIHALQPHAKVGTANHLRVIVPANPWHPYHVASATGMSWVFQDALLLAMNSGLFLPPLTKPDGMRRGRYYDFQGINYYSRDEVTHMSFDVAHGVPVNDLGWQIYPEGITQLARAVNRRFPGPIYITENGTCDAEDAFRARFIHDHLAQIAASDLPIERYYHWCFTDNFEWLDGEAARFGLVNLDFETQERTVRDSGRFYAEIIAQGGVTDEMFDRYVRHSHYRLNS